MTFKVIVVLLSFQGRAGICGHNQVEDAIWHPPLYKSIIQNKENLYVNERD